MGEAAYPKTAHTLWSSSGQGMPLRERFKQLDEAGGGIHALDSRRSRLDDRMPVPSGRRSFSKF